MKIAIIGAGITGLTAAYRLSRQKNQVYVFEQEPYAGGLMAADKDKDWDWPLEFYFHHLFPSDRWAINLLTELGLNHRLFFKTLKTSIYYQNGIYQFDSPISVLKFPFLSLFDKQRLGLATAFLKLTNDWQSLSKLTAYQWLKKYYGRKVFDILWQPLLLGKFHHIAPQISMAWFWARIKKRGYQFGYLDGGFQVLINKLIEEIKINQGEILLKSPVEKLSNLTKNFDRVIITTLSPRFSQPTKALPIFGAVNLLLYLRKPLLNDNTYWLNINQPGFPFVAVVEQTNFIDISHYGGNHLAYVGGYYPAGHRYFKLSKEAIYKEWLPYLAKINPQINQILNHQRLKLNLSLYAQPVFPVNYSRFMPAYQTANPKIYLANMQQIYPWDRSINNAIELAEKISVMVAASETAALKTELSSRRKTPRL